MWVESIMTPFSAPTMSSSEDCGLPLQRDVPDNFILEQPVGAQNLAEHAGDLFPSTRSTSSRRP